MDYCGKAVVTLVDTKESSKLNKPLKAANDILKILCKCVPVSNPRVAVNITLVVGALCLVVPPTAHLVISSASDFLLKWLLQYEHEHQQWSAAVSLGLIFNCFHPTDKKSKLQVINGLFEVISKTDSCLVKGACGLGLGYACQGLLTTADGHNQISTPLVMLRGSSGFYCYAIFEHAGDWPALNISEARLAFKLNTARFNYMALSDGIQRYMPRAADRDPPRGVPLAYKEAVLLLNPAEPQFKGEVDDKYQYSLDNKDNRVHGWIGGGPVPMGFWVVTPSNEFKSGGPLKRELTSHAGPTSLTMFLGTHYVGNDIVAKIDDGEQWKKVMGPVFIYLNSNPNRGNFRALWEDAKAQAEAEASKWPYTFLESPDFHKAGERASVTGRLLVRDKYVSVSGEDMPARLAYVGLAAPGAPGSWATESKGYQFWTRTSASCGSFAIGNVLAGEYNLYAWVPGFLGDYMYAAPVTVAAGGAVSLGDVVFEPPRSGPTLWEIGVPDRSAAEFFIPDPNPKYRSKLFLTRDKYRQYGLWERYAELYPHGDPVFTVGESHYSKDWFFAHVTRKVGTVTNAPTTRRIRFNLDRVVADGTYTLRVALAAAQMSRLQVQVNGATRKGSEGMFTTPEFGDGNAIARHGEHGTWWSFEFPIKGYLLMEGENTISITQVRAFSMFLGVVYDYIRLEGPPGSWRDPNTQLP